MDSRRYADQMEFELLCLWREIEMNSENGKLLEDKFNKARVRFVEARISYLQDELNPDNPVRTDAEPES